MDPWCRPGLRTVCAGRGGQNHDPRPGRALGWRSAGPCFTARTPNGRRAADFTSVGTWAGFVYVISFILDVFSQRSVGWHYVGPA